VPGKPTKASGYSWEFSEQVRATCLYLATKIDDLWPDLVIVGGLVPSLLITPKDEGSRHIGTQDIDLGLQVALLSEQRYQALTERLRQAGFWAQCVWLIFQAIPTTSPYELTLPAR